MPRITEKSVLSSMSGSLVRPTAWRIQLRTPLSRRMIIQAYVRMR